MSFVSTLLNHAQVLKCDEIKLLLIYEQMGISELLKHSFNTYHQVQC